MPLPGIDTATQAFKSFATNTVQTAIPAPLVAGADVIQGNQEKKTQKILEEARNTNKNISQSKLDDAKKTITGIVQPGINIFNPMNLLSNAWYFLVDILPIKHTSSKILTDNLEIFRNPKQTKDFQARAMNVFREHLKFLDIEMQRMGSKPGFFNIFPFNLFGKQNAEEERTVAEKTKYLTEVVQSLDEHLSFIKEAMVPNTVQGHTGFTDNNGKYNAALTVKDFEDLRRFSAEISDGGKYSKLKNYPPIQQIKAKVDEMVNELKPAYEGYAH
ncbi:MAG: hypothetical protein VKK32_04685 [Candidatus Melainabacteria bacterium]|nr:hypothetical protein [Candidatus Melainabacteria bacterium]